MNAAKRKTPLSARLAAVRLLLLLVVAFCGLETRVWSFAPAPPAASGEIALATPSFIGENYDALAYDASDSLVAAQRGEECRLARENAELKCKDARRSRSKKTADAICEKERAKAKEHCSADEEMERARQALLECLKKNKCPNKPEPPYRCRHE